ncbi:MAG: hypothetical protein CM1200mP23_4770 [Nitrososphaerota archaeon]|nr:MAG: hypothetical protein CM1200mP23_4770 [Nitrososphaerota archaeon]
MEKQLEKALKTQSKHENAFLDETNHIYYKRSKLVVISKSVPTLSAKKIEESPKK